MQVKVWNDNIYDFKEPNFKGQPIVVKAGEYITMDYEEAVEFQGKFSPMAPEDTADAEIPKYFKKIRIEKPEGASVSPSVTEYVCQLTGKKFSNLDDYKKHLVASAELYADSLNVDEAAEAEIAEKKKRKA